ncbi:MAG: hypothetical protein U0325_36155 [Polyangiales bacterium]
MNAARAAHEAAVTRCLDDIDACLARDDLAAFTPVMTAAPSSLARVAESMLAWATRP